MSATGKLAAVLVLGLAASAAAQGPPPTLESVPPVLRSTPDFYNAVAAPGEAVKLEWTASSTTVPLNSQITLTLTVRNAANPNELIRPDLTRFDEITRHFQVEYRQSGLAPGRAYFIYQLRPREVGRFDLPRLEYRYFRPDLPPGRQFRTTYTPLLTIQVDPPVVVAAEPPPVSLDGPEEFFAVPAPSRGPSPGRFGWLVPVAAIPVVVLVWVLVWRWLFPDAARLARLRRHRAVRMTLDRLRRARSAEDPAGEAAVAFRSYLVARFGVPPTAQTPAEVAAALRDLNHPDGQTADAERLLQRADGTRFSGHAVDEQALTLEAETLIRSWEEAE